MSSEDLPQWAVIVLAAGYGSRLHKDILADESGQFIHLLGQPKALLPVAGVPLLSHWLHRFREAKGQIDLKNVFVVTNDVAFPKFLKWAKTQEGFPQGNIINDKTRSRETRLGAIGDLKLVLDLKRKELEGMNVVIIAGDTLFVSDFDLSSFLEKLPSTDCGCVAYSLSNPAEVSKRGIAEVEFSTGLVSRLIEKPKPNETTSRFAVPAFYALRKPVQDLVNKYVTETKADGLQGSPGKFIGWLLSKKCIRLRTSTLAARFDIADLSQWKETLTHFSMVLDQHLNALPPRIVSRVCARIGVMGNPSDGFFGQTLSLSIANFFAEVTLRPSRRLVLVAHPEFDPSSFASLNHLSTHTEQNGYYGGLRLLKATCRKFLELCSKADVEVKGNFTMSYSSCIPRMVGLAGSSAIITAAFKGLMRFYGLSLEDLNLTRETLPQRILDIEVKELGINAGLQDRVIQVYGGLVHMNFDQKLIETCSHGTYTPLDIKLLPTMYLAWNTNVAGDSGKVHSTVKQRWLKGEKKLVANMRKVALLADSAKKALEEGKPELLCDLMDLNFKTRREMYGDNVVGARNIELASLANKHGMAAKFSGSGGAVVCLRRPLKSSKGTDRFAFSDEDEAKIRLIFIEKGYEFARIHPNSTASEPVVGKQVKRSTSYFSMDAASLKSDVEKKTSKSDKNSSTVPSLRSGVVLQID